MLDRDVGHLVMELPENLCVHGPEHVGLCGDDLPQLQSTAKGEQPNTQHCGHWSIGDSGLQNPPPLLLPLLQGEPDLEVESPEVREHAVDLLCARSVPGVPQCGSLRRLPGLPKPLGSV